MNYLTPEDISKLLRVHIRTVRRWIVSGQLKAIQVGRQYRISQVDYDLFLKQQEVQERPTKSDGLAAFAN